MSELFCARCKEFRFNPQHHVCPPKWAAVIFNERVPPSQAFAWEDVDNDEDVYAASAADAAELARAGYDGASASYGSAQLIVGVMPIAKFYNLEFTEDETSRLIDPAAMSWFRVDCEFEPSYHAERLEEVMDGR